MSSLRHRSILSALDTRRLLELARAAQVPAHIRRDRWETIAVLSEAGYSEFRQWMERLSVRELREICVYLGFEHLDGDPADLIDRILITG
ncbi:MAG TPA: hypothetical protein VIK91_06620, partial [Nannocystis sp.]